ncbi:MAG: transposase [Nitrospira sp.]|nr:transposase [Nitrospira sp.]
MLRCPEQNGKVESSHRVDEEEFWSRITFESFAAAAETLLAWERRYNHERFSMALNGRTPPGGKTRHVHGRVVTASVTHGPSESSSLPDLDHGPTADRLS